MSLIGVLCINFAGLHRNTHKVNVNIKNNLKFERVWGLAEVMSFECPSSTSKDKQLTLCGPGTQRTLRSGSWGVIIYPPRPARLQHFCSHRGSKWGLNGNGAHRGLNLTAGGCSRRTALCRWDFQLPPQPPAVTPHSCINYPVQCCQLIKWRLTKETRAEIM